MALIFLKFEASQTLHGLVRHGSVMNDKLIVFTLSNTVDDVAEFQIHYRNRRFSSPSFSINIESSSNFHNNLNSFFVLIKVNFDSDYEQLYKSFKELIREMGITFTTIIGNDLFVRIIIVENRSNIDYNHSASNKIYFRTMKFTFPLRPQLKLHDFLVNSGVEILSPSNSMEIDLTYSTKLNIIGNYGSYSPNSKLEILYGSYWYVLDHEKKILAWEPINKSSGSHWSYPTNISKFSNGNNLIKIKIFNDHSSFTDTINIEISGLEEQLIPPNDDPTSSSAILASNSPTNLDQISNLLPLPYFLLLLGGSLLFTSLFFFTKIQSHKTVLRISSQDMTGTGTIDSINRTSDRIEQLKDTLNSKYVNMPPKALKKDPIKFKRRRR